MSADSTLIVVTGFGPFVGHEKRNASWEAVKLLSDKLIIEGTEYTLEKQEVPVVYDAVNTVVPKIWEKNPKLVVHCGVHGNAKSLLLEKCAYTTYYNRPDFDNKCLPCDKVVLECGEKCEALYTNLDLPKITETLNTDAQARLCCSTEIGSYLCGYMYLKSLDQNRDRTLFVHVPPIDAPFSSKQTSDCIREVIEKCIQQLNDKHL